VDERRRSEACGRSAPCSTKAIGSGPQASLEALRAIAPYFRIRIRQADEILGEVERAVATWRDVGRSLGMSKGELGEFASAFEHKERLR
jgi:hypothetical protein